MLARSYICYYITCITVPLIIIISNCCTWGNHVPSELLCLYEKLYPLSEYCVYYVYIVSVILGFLIFVNNNIFLFHHFSLGKASYVNFSLVLKFQLSYFRELSLFFSTNLLYNGPILFLGKVEVSDPIKLATSPIFSPLCKVKNSHFSYSFSFLPSEGRQ